MGMEEVLDPLRRWTSGDADAGIATLLEVRRSAPRRPGARFAVSETGALAGSVSSGCVEGDLHEHLSDVLAGGDPRVVHYGITDEMAMEVGLACGGEIDVLVDRFEPDDPVWEELEAVLERQEAALLLMGLSGEIRGRCALYRPDGSWTGTLGSEALDRSALAAARPLLDTGGTEVLEVEPDGGAEPGSGEPGPEPGSDQAAEPGAGESDAASGSGVSGKPGPDPSPAELDEARVEVFAEAYLPPPRLAIVGASPVAEALCHLASYMGWSVTLVDPREAFADPSKYPDAERVVHEWPEEGLRAAGLDRWLDVVVLGHDRKIDVPALAAALETGCLYVGQIGGGRTQRIRREALEERGFSREQVARIRGPVGLDIGAETPDEIALSILAEMTAVKRGALS